MKTLWIRISIFLGLLAATAFCAGYFLLRSQGFFREPVYDAIAPEVPHLEKPALLVFSKTNGFIHREAIPAAEDMIRSLAQNRGWSTYFTANAAIHNARDLARFDAIIWNNVSGDVLTSAQRQAMIDYLKDGGGYVGIHASGGDHSYSWKWYAQTLLGAQFKGHPLGPAGPRLQRATVVIEAPADHIVDHLPKEWPRVDEWYSFRESPRAKGLQVLASLDESTYSPNMLGLDISMGDDHPVIWKHCLEQGRVFYSALGHTAESYSAPEYVTLLARAIAWAARLEGSHCTDT